jgi:DNA-binding FadR family transcriptional regulator
MDAGVVREAVMQLERSDPVRVQRGSGGRLRVVKP